MCLEDQFSKFEKSLTDDERSAINAWLGTYYEAIRDHQMTGSGDETIVQLARNFDTALDKAVICQETVYRGLSGGEWRPRKIAYMRTIIEGPEVFTLPCHDSASVMENIGREFTRTEPDDDKQILAVLLKVRPKTARYLAPLEHKAKHEGEVVLLRGSKFIRTSAERKADPKPNLEFWELEVEQVV